MSQQFRILPKHLEGEPVEIPDYVYKYAWQELQKLFEEQQMDECREEMDAVLGGAIVDYVEGD